MHSARARSILALAAVVVLACGGGGGSSTPASTSPALDGVVPTSGPDSGGLAVTLSGANLDLGAVVSFGGASAVVTGATATTLSVVAPSHAAGAVEVTVVNPDGQSVTLPAAFTYRAAPMLTQVAPGSGSTAGGTTLTLSGSSFAPGTSVELGGALAAVSSVADAEIVAVAPAHAAGMVDVTVTGPDGRSSTLAQAFSYVAPSGGLPAPTIAAVSPTSGPDTGGTTVTVTGSDFVTGAAVDFGGVRGVVVPPVTATQLTVTAPAHAAGVVDVTVVNPDGKAAALPAAFTFTAPPPVVAALNIRGAPPAGGTLVLIVGTGLQAGTGVTFGGLAATGTTFDPTTKALTVHTPAHDPGFVDVVVTNPDGQAFTIPAIPPAPGSSSFSGFHFGPPPTPSGFTPTTGPRGATVTITGADFSDANGVQVSFGGTPAPVVTRAATQLTVTVPKLNPGSYQVVVSNFDGQYGLAPGTFTAPGP